MNLWIDIAGAAQASLFAAVTFTRSVFSRVERGETVPDLRTLLRRGALALRRGAAAVRRAHRQEKVALLGLVLVLVFLSWP